MKIGVPKEIKDRENRVGMTPAGVAALTAAGHDILVEAGAGEGSGFDDAEYEAAGARLGSAATAWDCELVVKIKEPLESEFARLKDQLVFTYFHLAGVSPALTEALLDAGTTAIAYETVEDADGRLPLLAPMSAVAGDMALTIGNYYLAKFNDGRGMLLGRVLDRSYGKVLIIGDGVVGRHAARTAAAMGTRVLLFGTDERRLPELRRLIPGDFDFKRSTPENIASELNDCDLVVGAVLVRGARAPYVLTKAMIARMPAGSVVVDVSIDQGGCIETSRPTSHSRPVFTEHGVTHYCVTNMPGAYPRTSTIALTAATLPFVRKLADHGIDALRADRPFAKGINTHRGYITCRAVAEALGRTDRYREYAS